jgi:hypothetical protein
MFSFLNAHWDWLIAGIVGHVGFSGMSATIAWVRAKIAQVEAVAEAIKSKALTDAAAVKADVAAAKVVIPPVPPVAK